MIRRGFSLIELLLAIFILGLGMLSIAALFPAGIVLQQRAEDELNGPLVAQHAMGVLRSRLSPEDFGTWWDCVREQADLMDQQNPGVGQFILTQARTALTSNPTGTLAAWLRLSDWPWLRPSVVVEEGVHKGAVDIFNATGWNDPDATVGEHTADASHTWRRFLSFDPDDSAQVPLGIPFNLDDNMVEGIPVPPRVLITPQDRSWPPPDGSGIRPKYFWDCAFRKIGDRVQAAIFVYRAKPTAMASPAYRPGLTVQDDGGGTAPAIPWRQPLSLTTGMVQWQPGEGTADQPLPVNQTVPDINAHNRAWMQSGQWIMDQLGTVHRVMSGRDRNNSLNDVVLSAPVPGPMVSAMLDRNDLDQDGDINDVAFFTASTALPPRTFYAMDHEDFRAGVLRHNNFIHQFKKSVDQLFYMPTELVDESGVTYYIEPIYIVVEDL
ncbi:MAG: prepilin-type N-terminal cleavage/methylation domain-containing protein [Phycisphaerales bacterium]|nr:prepilin-type N-terminal cleavage/methylation domain-containing protein [Phycisphaerales bacterium]